MKKLSLLLGILTREDWVRSIIFVNTKIQALVGDFVDATSVIRSLRMVKSEAEIAKHQHICGIVSDAFDELPNLLSTGMTERQAFASFRGEILRQGADDVPYLVGATGPGGIDDIIRQPCDRVIESGDLLPCY